MIHLRGGQWTRIGAVLVFLLSGLGDRLITFADINASIHDLFQDIGAYKQNPAYTLSISLVSDGFVWIFFAIADIYQHREDDVAAEKVLRLATQIHQGPVSYSPLGAFYCNHGRYSEGIAVLEQAKPYGSQYYALQARQRLTICLCRAGKRDRALAEAQELSKIAPADTPFHSWDLQLIQNWSQLCATAQ